MRRFLLAFPLLVLSHQALAAGQRVWIAEFATTRQEAQAPIAALPASVKQTLDLTLSVNPQVSQPFKNTTRYIRIICEVQCALTVGSGATTKDTLLPALRPEYFGVSGGSTISVIAAP